VSIWVHHSFVVGSVMLVILVLVFLGFFSWVVLPGFVFFVLCLVSIWSLHSWLTLLFSLHLQKGDLWLYCLYLAFQLCKFVCFYFFRSRIISIKGVDSPFKPYVKITQWIHYYICRLSLLTYLVCAKHLHYRIIPPRGQIWSDNAKPVKWAVMYLCVWGIDFAFFYDFSIECWNCMGSVVFIFHFIIIML